MIILAGLTRVPHRKHPSRSTFSIVSVNVPVEKRLKTIRYAKMTNSLKQKKKKNVFHNPYSRNAKSKDLITLSCKAAADCLKEVVVVVFWMFSFSYMQLLDQLC